MYYEGDSVDADIVQAVALARIGMGINEEQFTEAYDKFRRELPEEMQAAVAERAREFEARMAAECGRVRSLAAQRKVYDKKIEWQPLE